MPVRDQALMDGTTLCSHCSTRFRITHAQLEAHQGMVRCGSCQQAFDARPGFIPDQPDPQLELPIVEETVAKPAPVETPAEPAVERQAEQASSEFEQPAEKSVTETQTKEVSDESAQTTEVSLPEGAKEIELVADESAVFEEEVEAIVAAAESEAAHDDSLDFSPSSADGAAAKPLVLQSAMRVDDETVDDGEEEIQPEKSRRRWAWITGLVVLSLLLCAQALYFFRIELGARLPGVKPALVSYCKLLNCTVPLPQNADLMSIESSELEADPSHENQITLVALLRNRASHAQAFPSLELSLNDTDDKVLARRTFKPADYLPPGESEAIGLKPNHELNIRLGLDTSDLRPTGYRLALFYPQ